MRFFSSWFRALGACSAALIIAAGLAACGDEGDNDSGGDSGSGSGGGKIALLLPETKTTRTGPTSSGGSRSCVPTAR